MKDIIIQENKWYLKEKIYLERYNGLYDLTLIMNYLWRIMPYVIAILMDTDKIGCVKHLQLREYNFGF